MPRHEQIKLGLSMRGHGYHRAAWRHKDVPPDGPLDFKYFLRTAQAAERAKFDLVFFADAGALLGKDEPPGSLEKSGDNAQLEPLTLIAALGAMTSNIGLVSTASTTYNLPYHLARKFSSIDHISGGRAGWNVVTSWSDLVAQNYGKDAHADYQSRYDMAREFVEVVLALWDSWEDDAFVHDKQSGIFYRPEKVHAINHKGPNFSVRGPLNISRTPQGHPVVVQAGASEPGQELAAATAEVVYAAQHDMKEAQEFYKSVKGRMAKYDRSPDDLKIFPGFTPVVGHTRTEAEDKAAELQKLIDPLVGLSTLYQQFGDLRGYPLDGPVPEPENPVRVSRAKLLLSLARRENLTIRGLYERVAMGNTVRLLVGTPQDIADDMQAWFESFAADGFNVCPTHLPGGLDDFAALVIPELQRRGLFRKEYEASTLRGNLGLGVPVNNRHSDSSSHALLEESSHV